VRRLARLAAASFSALSGAGNRNSPGLGREQLAVPIIGRFSFFPPRALRQPSLPPSQNRRLCRGKNAGRRPLLVFPGDLRPLLVRIGIRREREKRARPECPLVLMTVTTLDETVFPRPADGVPLFRPPVSADSSRNRKTRKRRGPSDAGAVPGSSNDIARYFRAPAPSNVWLIRATARPSLLPRATMDRTPCEFSDALVLLVCRR